MGAMTKGVSSVALFGVVACGATEVEVTPTPAPTPVQSATAYSEDGLFSARWVEGQGELRVTRWTEHEPGCRSASYQLQVLDALGSGPVELRYDRRNLETRLLLGWARVDGATLERLQASTLSGPGPIEVSPAPSARYCVVGPEVLQALPDPESARAPIGSGQVFALRSWRFAGAREGLDGASPCTNDQPCWENRLAFLGRFNDQLRQHVLGGDLLQLVELVGLDSSEGLDPQWVLKAYLGLDADHPPAPANNFQPSERLEGCCEFRAAERSVEAGQARVIAAGVYGEGVATTTEDSSYELVLDIDEGVLQTVIKISLVRWRFWLNAEPPTIEGRLAGVASIFELAGQPDRTCWGSQNCTWGWSAPVTWLDTVATRVTPDRDLDGDGLESVYDADGDGHIDRCCDGPLEPDGSCRPGEEVRALLLEDPGSCALQPEMADGYSLTMAFEGVPAQLIGVGPAR